MSSFYPIQSNFYFVAQIWCYVMYDVMSIPVRQKGKMQENSIWEENKFYFDMKFHKQ